MKKFRSEDADTSREPTMAERLLSSEREQWADSERVVALLGVASDARIADIGCGPGYYTVRLASIARRGVVHALDVDPEMLELCHQTVSAAGLENVHIARCGEYEFGLDCRSLDAVFLSCVIHHADDPVRFLSAARRSLKRSGRCAMLEWVERESEFGPPVERRIGRDRLVALATEAGYSDLQYHRLSEHQYLLTAACGDAG
jgi:ubiquinone/menaquinone biosynthesis C-methylase UbiE